MKKIKLIFMMLMLILVAFSNFAQCEELTILNVEQLSSSEGTLSIRNNEYLDMYWYAEFYTFDGLYFTTPYKWIFMSSDKNYTFGFPFVTSDYIKVKLYNCVDPYFHILVDEKEYFLEPLPPHVTIKTYSFPNQVEMFLKLQNSHGSHGKFKVEIVNYYFPYNLCDSFVGDIEAYSTENLTLFAPEKFRIKIYSQDDNGDYSLTDEKIKSRELIVEPPKK